MALSKEQRDNFDELKRAFEDGNAALVECVDAETSEKVPVICAINEHEKEVELVPFALLVLDGYARFIPPPADEVKESTTDNVTELIENESEAPSSN